MQTSLYFLLGKKHLKRRLTVVISRVHPIIKAHLVSDIRKHQDNLLITSNYL